MKRAVCVCCLLLGLTTSSRAEHRHALVIGNSKYPKAELASPPNDVRAVGEALQKRGFVVSRYEDVDDKTLKAAFDEFARSVPIRGTALVYFSGYAVPLNKPDAPNADNALRPIDGGFANGILTLMNRLAADGGSALNILLVDGCYAYPMTSGASRGLQKPAKLPNESRILFAAPFGEFIEPVREGLSPMARRLVEALSSSLPLSEVLDRLSPTQLSTAGDVGQLSAPASRAVASADSCRPGAKAGDEWTNDIGTVFCWCPPGRAVIGSPEGETNRQDDEHSVAVTLSRGFWMSKYEFTRSEHKALSKNSGVYLSTGDHKLHPLNHAHIPTNVPAILSKLNEHAPSGWHYALPTEAEWEYACRAGTTAAYSFGAEAADLPRYGNFADRSLRECNTYGEIGKAFNRKPYLGDRQLGLFTYAHKTWNDGYATMSPVGCYLPNAWGLHDMHGNMAEMTATPYDADGQPPTEPDSKSGLGWVLKGGGWLSTADYCRSAFRGQSAQAKENYVGLRIILRENETP